jgi:hypothetical protein
VMGKGFVYVGDVLPFDNVRVFRDNVCVDLYCSCTFGFRCFGGVLDMVNSRV